MVRFNSFKLFYYANLVIWFVVLLEKYRPEFGYASYLAAAVVILVSHCLIRLLLPADLRSKIFN